MEAEFVRLDRELREMVAARQPSQEERQSPVWREARIAAGRARAEAFARATQGKGKPGCKAVYGSGKPASS